MAHNVFKMSFAKVYPLYVNKVERKGGTRNELDIIIYWLTGYSDDELKSAIANEVSVQEFFENFPKLNENAHLITGMICGYRVEDIQDPLMKRMRYLDKLVDELAKGKQLDKILRG